MPRSLGPQDTHRASADPHRCPDPRLGVRAGHQRLGPCSPSAPPAPWHQTIMPCLRCLEAGATSLPPLGLLPPAKGQDCRSFLWGMLWGAGRKRARAYSCVSSRKNQGAASPGRAPPHARMRCACASGPSSRLHHRACGPQAKTGPWTGGRDLEADQETVGGSTCELRLQALEHASLKKLRC